MSDCIPLYRPGSDISARATAAVASSTFVSVSSALDAASGTLVGVTTAAAGEKAFGVAVRDTAPGNNVAVIAGPGTVVPVLSADAVSAGSEVEVGADGKAAALASGKPAGLALSTASSADAELFVKLY